MNKHFARTNAQTIAQRAKLIAERLPAVRSIGELCCGDCLRQSTTYTAQLSLTRYCGLDIDPAVVAHNHINGVECICGDVMDATVLRTLAAFDLLFYGPPLSVDCDGHRLLAYTQVKPAYDDFVALLLGQLGYAGALVCICPRTTTLGDVAALHHRVQTWQPQMGLGVINHSYSTVTGRGDVTEPRLKYVELWFAPTFEDAWRMEGERIRIKPD